MTPYAWVAAYLTPIAASVVYLVYTLVVVAGETL